jgi:hypothetical protein
VAETEAAGLLAETECHHREVVPDESGFLHHRSRARRRFSVRRAGNAEEREQERSRELGGAHVLVVCK